jgi:hypothetical protein
MASPTHHPVLERLLSPQEPFARHALLHDLELRLLQARPTPALAARVHHFVERGVPYFAPQDAHYRAWAEKAAELWDELSRRPKGRAALAN